MGFGRKLERVANTPRRLLPPSLGGRTVGLHVSRMFSENTQTSQRWLKPSRPRNASQFLNSGSNWIVARRSLTSPLWRGMPNLPVKSLWILAMILKFNDCMFYPSPYLENFEWLYEKILFFAHHRNIV